MSVNSKPLQTTFVNGTPTPIPQYYDDREETYNAVRGADGAPYTRNVMEYYGPTIENRPPPNSVPVGAYYMAVRTQEIWQSDGTEWVNI